MATTATAKSPPDEVQDSWVPMIAIALGQMIMSFNVASLPVAMGGMVESFDVPPTTIARSTPMAGDVDDGRPAAACACWMRCPVQ